MECTIRAPFLKKEDITELFCFCFHRKEQLAAEKLATEERAAKQAETLGELTEANLQLALLEDINPVQTENGNLRKKLHALEKL